jgi:hypothetical protein
LFSKRTTIRARPIPTRPQDQGKRNRRDDGHLGRGRPPALAASAPKERGILQGAA